MRSGINFFNNTFEAEVMAEIPKASKWLGNTNLADFLNFKLHKHHTNHQEDSELNQMMNQISV